MTERRRGCEVAGKRTSLPQAPLSAYLRTEWRQQAGGQVRGSEVGRAVMEGALDAFYDPNSTTAAHVHRAVRIATRRQDYVGQIRLVTWTIDVRSRG